MLAFVDVYKANQHTSVKETDRTVHAVLMRCLLSYLAIAHKLFLQVMHPNLLYPIFLFKTLKKFKEILNDNKILSIYNSSAIFNIYKGL